MVRMMIDSDIGQIMERINSINGTSLMSFQTVLLENLPDKETVRSQLFNYSVAIYGYYENDKLLGLIYYQLPSVISFQGAATIYWINCDGMPGNMFRTLLVESAEDLFRNSGMNKVKIHLTNASFFGGNIEDTLTRYGFVKEAEIKHGVGWQNDLLVFALIRKEL